MKKEKRQQLAHLIAGVITLVFGFDNFESGDLSSATYFLALGIIFLIVAGSYKWIVQKFLQADVAFYLVEAATLIYAAWNYQLKGRNSHFFVMVVAGMLYFIFAIISFLSKGNLHRRSRRRKSRRRSSSSRQEKKLSGDDIPQ